MGKGGGKAGKGGEHSVEGKLICFNWNRKAACKAGAACNMAHVCLKCHGSPTSRLPQLRSWRSEARLRG